MNLHKNLFSRSQFFQADRRTDTIKLTVALCNFETASIMCLKYVLQQQQQHPADIALCSLGGTGAMSPADPTYW